MNYGERDGYGQAVGYFGDRPNRVAWKLWAENVIVRFYDAKTGKQVYQAQASNVDDTIRAEQKRELSPEASRISQHSPGRSVMAGWRGAGRWARTSGSF